MAGISLPTIACRSISRRGVLRASAAFAALLGGLPAIVPGARAEAPADPLVPIPLPPQVPAREGVAALADTRLWFWDTGGSGEPIVLLHPASGSALIWGYQQPVFAKAGYRVIAYSRRGYYNSQPIERAHPGIGSEDLHQLVEFLGLGKFHLVASAAGGSIASDYAFSHPERLLSLTISSNQFGVTDGEIHRRRRAHQAAHLGRNPGRVSRAWSVLSRRQSGRLPALGRARAQVSGRRRLPPEAGKPDHRGETRATSRCRRSSSPASPICRRRHRSPA